MDEPAETDTPRAHPADIASATLLEAAAVLDALTNPHSDAITRWNFHQLRALALGLRRLASVA
jgi:hypothetical protein